jgi:hypothetical protein
LFPSDFLLVVVVGEYRPSSDCQHFPKNRFSTISLSFWAKMFNVIRHIFLFQFSTSAATNVGSFWSNYYSTAPILYTCFFSRISKGESMARET